MGRQPEHPSGAKISVNIRLSPDLVEILDKQAGRLGLNRSRAVARLISSIWGPQDPTVDQTAENQARGVVTTSATGLNLDRQAAGVVAHDCRYVAGSSGVLACTICGKLKT